MHQLKDIIENKIINDLTKSFIRSPKQLNKVHETDAEIIELENSPYNLAITIDTISEEIKTGLYSDPYQIGWMSVMVNMSDLAAVGASPIGIVVSQILPKEISKENLDKIQNGINDACKKCGTFVLGGDTNFGDELIISGCAIGTVEKGNHLKRVGCKTGDKIYLTGIVGNGNAFAAQKLFFQDSELSFRSSLRERNLKSNKSDRFLPSVEMTSKNGNGLLEFFPSAKLEWRNILIKYSSSCIDTSDGVLSSLDQLMRLNNIGFRFRNDWHETLDPSSKHLFAKYNFPFWLLLAGEHGEFELLFSIPEENEAEFLNEADRLNLNPVYLAYAISEQNIKINLYDKEQTLDSGKIRNLAFEKDFSPAKYMQKLMEINTSLES
ncbi:MAG: thiamine-monophosphate kinase [Ignavibacterium sp.]|nr:thiamine-monophosphate kinase [Ignavibacterium sp.]